MTEKIVFDCDPGSDDAIAILEACAHPDKLDILGLTTVGGNQILSNVTRNAQHLLWFLKRDVPIAAGQDRPIIKNLQNASEFHGENGLAGPTFPAQADEYPVESRNAVHFLYEKISQSQTPVIVVATAPLTNIALLLKVFPEVKDNIKQLVIMGGSLSGGNVTDGAEFNFYVDPDAAHIVLTAGIDTVLCGLDVTNDTAITQDEIDSLKDKGPASHLAYEILVPYANAEIKHHGFEIAPIHDLATISYLLDPSIFKGEKMSLVVDNSWGEKRGTVEVATDDKAAANVLVLKEVDRDKAIKLLIDSLEQLDLKLS